MEYLKEGEDRYKFQLEELWPIDDWFFVILEIISVVRRESETFKTERKRCVPINSWKASNFTMCDNRLCDIWITRRITLVSLTRNSNSNVSKKDCDNSCVDNIKWATSGYLKYCL
jgi:hypothetical protein